MTHADNELSCSTENIEQEKQLKLFKFDKEPTFAELWDKCVYNLLYEISKYKQDIEKLFKKLGITKESKIIDVSAGGVFYL